MGFEIADSAAEAYLEEPLCNERISAALASLKATLKDGKLFSLRITKDVKAAISICWHSAL